MFEIVRLSVLIFAAISTFVCANNAYNRDDQLSAILWTIGCTVDIVVFIITF